MIAELYRKLFLSKIKGNKNSTNKKLKREIATANQKK